MGGSVRHDLAYGAALAIFHRICHAFREEERRELFGILYEAVKEALGCYEEKLDHRSRRLSATDGEGNAN
jgi:hypothetical protein